MATYTTNYSLKKPAGNEPVLRQDYNDNLDSIDALLAQAEDITDHLNFDQGVTITGNAIALYKIGRLRILNLTGRVDGVAVSSGWQSVAIASINPTDHPEDLSYGGNAFQHAIRTYISSTGDAIGMAWFSSPTATLPNAVNVRISPDVFTATSGTQNVYVRGCIIWIAAGV